MFLIHTCQYIAVSEIFRNFTRAWEVFTECEMNYSWGNNYHTMARASDIIEYLEEEMSHCNEDPDSQHDTVMSGTFESLPMEDENDPTLLEVLDVIKLLKTIPEDVFIDLES
jgi:hypothetical protein